MALTASKYLLISSGKPTVVACIYRVSMISSALVLCHEIPLFRSSIIPHTGLPLTAEGLTAYKQLYKDSKL